jgi:hypothetical protein
VIGLVQGLGKLYNTPATAIATETRAAGAEHDVFDVKWENPI